MLVETRTSLTEDEKIVLSNKETLSASKPSNERRFSHPNPSGYKEFS